MIVRNDAASETDEIELRIRRSLEREGYDGMKIMYLGDGHVRIVGELASKQDRLIVYNIARTVQDVAHVRVDPANKRVPRGHANADL